VDAVTDDLPPSPTESDLPPSPGRRGWQEIFEDLAAGRRAALEELYDLAAKDLYGLALWRTGSEDDAADVVQDVFVKVVEQGDRLARIRNPRAWLLTVTHRKAIDATRRRRRRSAEPLEEYPFLTAAEHSSERMLDAAQVSLLLASVSESQRELLYLRHFAGCTYSEIGTIIGIPTFTAASRYRRAVADLRRLMEDTP
jgi:RNA polymerase sigma-70 factor (ECF subfamily)